MALMVGITYPDHEAAKAAKETADGLVDAGYLTIMDWAILEKDDNGKVKEKDSMGRTSKGALSGLIVGGLLGAIFLVPVAGLVLGGLAGAFLGRESDPAHGEVKKFMETLRDDLPDNGSALIVLGSSDAPDRVIQNLGRHGGVVHSTDLSEERIAALQAEIDKGNS